MLNGTAHGNCTNNETNYIKKRQRLFYHDFAVVSRSIRKYYPDIIDSATNLANISGTGIVRFLHQQPGL